MKRKTLRERAKEFASAWAGWWCYGNLIEAYEAGYRAAKREKRRGK